MKLVGQLLALGVICCAPIANAAENLTVYSYRQAFLIQPILADFTQKTGINVDVVFSKNGIAERMQREGRLSKADVVLTSDFSRLMELADKGLVAPAHSETLAKNIPEKFRSPKDDWYALTMRVRNIYSSKAKLGGIDINYEDLASPEYKGKICTRSGKHPYNVSLVASMIAHHGEAEAKTWLEGVKANLARKPQGNDRAQVKAVSEGLCDIAIGNSYYLGKMLQDPKQKPWADAVVINFPNQSNHGSHINVSGMALAKYSPNKAAAIQLMEYLSSDDAQRSYADVNMEYPVKADVLPSELVASWGKFKADSLPIYKLAQYHNDAVKLLDEVRFDL